MFNVRHVVEINRKSNYKRNEVEPCINFYHLFTKFGYYFCVYALIEFVGFHQDQCSVYLWSMIIALNWVHWKLQKKKKKRKHDYDKNNNNKQEVVKRRTKYPIFFKSFFFYFYLISFLIMKFSCQFYSKPVFCATFEKEKRKERNWFRFCFCFIIFVFCKCSLHGVCLYMCIAC